MAVGWSFPNYFAGLPSWWLLVCALACMWAVIRHVETRQWQDVAVGGLAAGVAIAIKQTGIYLLIAFVLWILYAARQTSRSSSWLWHLERITRWTAAVAAIVSAAAVLWPRISATEGVYLFLPTAACALVLFAPPEDRPRTASEYGPLSLVCLATVAAALPLLCLMIPYIVHDRVWEFVNGTLFLPRKRLAFASGPMRNTWALVTGLPLLALVFAVPRLGLALRPALVKSLLWAGAIAIPLFALSNVTSYQAIWQSSRAVAVLLPLAVCWRLAAGRIQRPEQRSIVFGATAVLTWMSLNQFPFAAPIYFCYVAPLAVIAAVVTAHAESSLRRGTLLPWAVMLLLFAVASANRGYLDSLGVNHAPRQFDTPLRLSRASLKVSAGDARAYRWLMFVVRPHLQGGQLVAGPDCPQVYFLAERTNPSGALFDFFSADAAGRHDGDDIAAWENAEVIVVNHAPHFSPPLSHALLAQLRGAFQFGERSGSFEARWR